MNPPTSETSGISLPAPQEQAPLPAPPEAGVPASAEHMPATPEAAERVAQSYAAALPATPQADDQQATTSDANDTTSSAVPQIADDRDLIDKAVVEKAKSIVAQTATDPYKQTQELTALKAEFMQHNYNKTIKLSP